MSASLGGEADFDSRDPEEMEMDREMKAITKEELEISGSLDDILASTREKRRLQRGKDKVRALRKKAMLAGKTAREVAEKERLIRIKRVKNSINRKPLIRSKLHASSTAMTNFDPGSEFDEDDFAEVERIISFEKNNNAIKDRDTEKSSRFINADASTDENTKCSRADERS